MLPTFNKNVKKADRQALKNALKGNATWTPPKEWKPPANPEPVALKVKEVNRNGLMDIQFNQKLVVPPFIDRDKSGSSDKDRKLMPVSAVDLTLIMEIQLQLKQEIPAS